MKLPAGSPENTSEAGGTGWGAGRKAARIRARGTRGEAETECQDVLV